MTPEEYNNINEDLKCPVCHSTCIDLYFINESSEEVSMIFVEKNQEISVHSHVCECESCGYEDDRIFFNY